MGMCKVQRELSFGRALARVLAHELYHILLDTEQHAKSGVTKSHLTPHDLIGESLDFEPDQIEQFRVSAVPGS